MAERFGDDKPQIAETPMDQDSNHDQLSQVVVNSALRSSDDRLREFHMESERSFEQFVDVIRHQHRQYVKGLASLHSGLQDDIRNLSDMKVEFARFLCPSALQTFGTVQENAAAVASTPADVADPHHISAEILPSPSAAASPSAPAIVRPAHSATGGNSGLTEDALKHSLFMALAPLYGLREKLTGAFVPLQKAIQTLSSDVSELKKRTIQSRPIEGLQGGFLSTEEMLYGDFGNAISIDDPKKNAENFGKKHTGLARGTGHMDFAADLLNSTDEPFRLMTCMHEVKVPGEKRKAWILPMEGEPVRTSGLAIFLRSEHFERVVSLIILLNLIFITYSTDYAVQHPHDQTNEFIRFVETVFQVLYMCELTLKLLVHQKWFFIGQEWVWNWLDIILVVTAVYDLIVSLTNINLESQSADQNNFNLTFLRVLRLARFSKVIRVFRVVRFVDELHVLGAIIASSLKPLFWCASMLVVFYYIFGIIFVYAATGYFADPDQDKSRQADVEKHWGSVAQAMLSLFKASTGGEDWGLVSESLQDVGNFYFILFLFFISFIILALMNILTGIFVDRAMKASADDKDGEVLAKLTNDRSAVRDLCKLHCVISKKTVEDKATINATSFQEAMKSAAMRARFSVLGLEIWDSDYFFSILTDLAESDEVDLLSFVNGAMQMRGMAQRLQQQGMSAHINALAALLRQSQIGKTRSVSSESLTAV